MALCAAHSLQNQTMHTSIKEISNTDTNHIHVTTASETEHPTYSTDLHQDFTIPTSKSNPNLYLNMLSTHPSCVSHHIIAQEGMERAGKRRPYLDLPHSRPQFRPPKSNAQPNFGTKLVRESDFFLSSDPPVFLYPCPQCARRDAIAKKDGRQNVTTQCQ